MNIEIELDMTKLCYRCRNYDGTKRKEYKNKVCPDCVDGVAPTELGTKIIRLVRKFEKIKNKDLDYIEDLLIDGE